jgi:hypothetical protein
MDAELLELFSDPERRHGVRAPGGWFFAHDHEPLVSTDLCPTHGGL